MTAAFETRAPAGARRLRNLLLCSVACFWATGALADGGSGAAGDAVYGGTGGVNSVTGVGGNGTTPGNGGNAAGGAGAGGGAGVSGGSGGLGMDRSTPTTLPTAPGGAGGAAPGQSGADGTSPTSSANGGSGGGGGGGGAHGFVGSLPTSSASGGNGGNGGAGQISASNDGGGGGAGGYGAVVSGGSSPSTVGVDFIGGRGGAGGFSNSGFGGNGGSGGIGLHSTSMSLTLGGNVRGGNGGNGGGGNGQGGHGAAGGSGIVDSGSTFTSLGAIAGGNGGNGGNGNSGSFPNTSAKGGDGAAGGTGFEGGNSTFTNRGTLVGGAGGAGGNGGALTGLGGNGAAGGAGFTGSNSTFTNHGTLAGGNGGNGGNGGANSPGRAGSGAAGGAGALISGSTLVNHGTITGGNGGTAGTGRTAGTAGAAGIGIRGSDLNIVNSGTITGGLGGNGVTRANAIAFTGGVNTLELRGGSSITGNVTAFSAADTFKLGGDVTATFNAAQIGGPGAQYSGFGHFEKTGSSFWTLTGTTAQTTPWLLSGGALAVAADASLGAAAGGLTFNGGTLRVTGTSFTSTARSISFGNAGGGFDIADGGNTFTVSQALGGSGMLTKRGNGTLVLSGANSYSGGTTIAEGFLQAGNAGAIGSGTLTLDGGAFRAGTNFVNSFANAIRVNPVGGGIDANGQVITLSGNITDGSGPGGELTFGNTAGAIGGIELSGTNTYSGRTSVSARTTLIAASNGAFSPNSNMRLAATGALKLDGYSATVRSLSGSGIVANASDTAAGTLTINTPDVIVAAFTGTLIDDEPGGSGKPLALVKSGYGLQSITGTSTLSGPITITGGQLVLNGSYANAAVNVAFGILSGNSTVKSLVVGSQSIVSPGNSIGTITVNGDLVLAPGSTYLAEIAGNGTSDLIAVGGSATITGANVVIAALDPQVSYQTGQRYTILTAAGGINGSFAEATTSSAFLDLALDRRTGGVDLTVKIKGSDPTAPAPVVFQSAAQTRNQFSTALALNTLPQVGGTLALYNSLLMLDAASARGAFDQLSGEIHASAKTALVEEGSALRSAAIDRLRSAFGSVGSAPMATMNYGFTADLAPSLKGPMPRLAQAERFAVWGQGYGSWGRTDGDRNAAKLTRSTGGLMIGADMALFDTMRLGVLAGYSHGEFDAKGRLSSGESDNYHLGLYGGGQFGALGLRLGASYTWHDVSTRRTVAFAGFGDNPRGDYQAGTAQVFGELGYRFDLARIALEPFAGLAYVNLQTDGFREIGGAAALSARGDDTSLGYSTLGLRASTSFAMQGMDLTLRGALAWRHAFGDVDPATTLAFSGSNAFTVAGLPIAKNAALVEAGLDLAISKNTTLGISYTGQLAADAQDHAFKANLAVRF